MLDIELDLLEEKQIIGPKRLKIFDKIGTKRAPTDFAIICGAQVSVFDYVDNERKLENRTSCYYTKTSFPAEPHIIRTIFYDGSSNYEIVNHRHLCIIPVIPFSKIRHLCKNIKRNKDGKIEFAECGLFPENLVSEKLEQYLDNQFSQGLLNKVDYVPTDSRRNYEYDKRFSIINQNIYETNGNRYARVKANPYNPYEIRYSSYFTLPNKKSYKIGDNIWLECHPILLGVDEEEDIAFPIKGIVSGIQFHHRKNYNGNFKETDLYDYMNNYLLRSLNLEYSSEKSDKDSTIYNNKSYLITEANNQMTFDNKIIGDYQKSNIDKPKTFQKK